MAPIVLLDAVLIRSDWIGEFVVLVDLGPAIVVVVVVISFS